MRTSLKDIADRVGVTPQLVSFYLNHPETTRVKKETREKIDEAVRQLNYRANTVGRALSTGKTRTIGLIMGGFAARKRGCYVHALMNEAKKRGYHLLIAITNYDREEEREALEHMLSRQVDGILYTLSLEGDGEMAERLQALHFPILSHTPYRLENFDTSDYDYRDSIEAMVRHLKDNGKKKLFFRTSPSDEATGFLEESARKHGLDYRLHFQSGEPFSCEEYAEAVLRERPDVIVEPSEPILRELLGELPPRYRPEFISYYSLPFEFINHPRVTGYIHRFHNENAAANIARIVELIEDPKAPPFRHLRVPTEFLTVEETAALRLKQLNDPFYRQFK